MLAVILLVLLYTSLVKVRVEGALGDANTSTILPVLVLLPFPANHSHHGWDRGLDLLPAARIAVREVNNRTDMLVGYEIQLIEASSDDCGVSVTANSVSNYVRHSLSKSTSLKAIAVVGLVCSTVTSSVSQVAGQSEIDLLQISMSNSPIFRHKSIFNRLWRILPSTVTFINTTLSLFNRFNVSRVSIVYDQLGVYYQTSAEAFRETLQVSNITQLLHIGIEESDTFIDNALSSIRNEAARIIYLVGTIPEVIRILCKAEERNLIWPGYLWIIPDRQVQDFLDNQYCNNHAIGRALENVILLDFQLNNTRPLNDRLVSGKRLSEYYELYREELDRLKLEEFIKPYLATGYSIKPNRYANAMYDEVWALSLALNASLPDLDRLNLSLKHYQYNMSKITDVIEGHLQNVHFTGVVNDIAFDSYRESLAPVLVHQVRNSSEILIGKYSHELILLNNSNIKFVRDTFDIQYNLIPLPLAIIFYTSAGIILILITVTLILMMTVVYNEHEVKATSPLLSLIIFMGGYFDVISSILLVTNQSFLLDKASFISICMISHWMAACGLNLIGTTVLVKLVRVHRVFTHFGRTSKIWKDKYLFFIILAIALIFPTCLIVTFSSFLPPRYNQVSNYIYDSNPPVNLISLECGIDFVRQLYIVLIFIHYFIIISFLVFFSIQTRKVDRKDFKDTKKILAFVFLHFILFESLIAVSIVLKVNGEEKNANIVLALCLQLNTLFSIGLLIMPKVFPACYRKLTSKSAKLQVISNKLNRVLSSHSSLLLFSTSVQNN
jgi:gamma-aminobutyric acid type B receptor